MTRREPHSSIAIPAMAQRPSGLWTPVDAPRRGVADAPLSLAAGTGKVDNTLFVVGRKPSDMDTMFVAPDPEALGVDAPSLNAIREVLSSVPVEPAIFGVSALVAAAWFAGRDQQAHLQLAYEIFGERPVMERLRAFVRQAPHHLIFNEQHLTILTRLLLEHGRDGDVERDLEDHEVDALLIAFLGIGGLTARHGDPENSDTREPLGWVPWLVRSGLYFDRTNLGNEQARARALFVAGAKAADRNGPNWCDLQAWVEQDLASVPDQLGFGYGMGAFAKALDEEAPIKDRFIGVVSEGLFAGNLPADTVARLLEAVSASRGEFIDAFRASGDTIDHLLWDRAVFERRPFLRLRDRRLVLLSPRFLHAWMGEGQYYRLLDSAGRRPDPARPRKKATLRFTRFHGELVERYLLRLTEASHVDQVAAGVVRIHSDRAYTGTNGTERRSPDVVLDFVTDLVAIEITGGRPTRRARVLSDPKLMIEELDSRVIRKMTELDRALGDVLEGIVDLPDLTLDLVERVWPIVIIPSTVIQSDVLWDHIYERAPGLFSQHPALQHPTLFSFEDYELAMAAVEAGQGLPAVVGQRLESVFARMPPSHFFAARMPGLPRPRLLNEQFIAATDEAFRKMFPPSR